MFLKGNFFSESKINPKKKFNLVLDFLNENLTDFAFTGSISLFVFKISDRLPKDIDIVTSLDNINKIKEKYPNYIVEQCESDMDDDTNNCNIVIGGYVIDIFETSEFEKNLISSKYKFTPKNIDVIYQDTPISITHPYWAIKAKKDYIVNYMKRLANSEYISEKGINSLMKHINDINSYNEIGVKNMKPKNNKLIINYLNNLTEK